MDIITRSRKHNCNRVRSHHKTKTLSRLQLDRSIKEIPPLLEPIDIERGVDQCIHDLQKSKSYQAFYKQLQRHPFRSKIKKVLGEEKKFQMVIYGIGNISSNPESRFQLAFALLLKWHFGWIGEIEVYDPKLKAEEHEVFKKFGCKVLSANENAKRKANVPTLAFMPHCEFHLYNNLVKANWSSDLLNKLVIVGNSFGMIKWQAGFDPKTFKRILTNYIVQSEKLLMVEELPFTSLISEFPYPFFMTSWHFFHIDSWVQLKAP